MTDSSSDVEDVVDLFAGAGGWEEGLAGLGCRAIGIETDAVACETARAAGHRRETLDVAEAEPRRFGPVRGVVGSPPCQAESHAGKGLGRADRPHVVACARDLAAGRDTRAAHLARCRDPRSLLTVEPLRWALALGPEWIALEQVPPVLAMWELFAELLVAHGYHCDVGILSAERYGVPQTRRRAFLIANRTREVRLPAPTHRSYDPRNPERVLEHERGLLPWVSMADALGFGLGAVNHTNCNLSDQRPRGMVRPAGHPARTVTTKAGWWTVVHPSRRGSDGARHPRGHGARVSAAADPRGHGGRLGRGHRLPTTALETTRTTRRGRPQKLGVRGAGRVHPKPIGDRLTVEQAAALQGFRSDYPWQGSPTRRFMQIGNAVCPPVAHRVLAAAMGRPGGDHA